MPEPLGTATGLEELATKNLPNGGDGAYVGKGKGKGRTIDMPVAAEESYVPTKAKKKSPTTKKKSPTNTVTKKNGPGQPTKITRIRN
ncbi:hypothetical protein Slin15195_G023950 [Septoria linicola]|uniref:Uncharacterized protein n=1 Tax=Septoria linicola TaxID=215465 RepID=A0A9Q9AQR3_9PEZI|nr:hypothetical protein Slin15195_G023950 [Septoria linicola]